MSGAGMPPHQVEILYDLEGAGNATVCAGTIISSYFILTVASCLAGRNESLFKIRANGKNGNEGQFRKIADVFSYAALNSDPSSFDVALIRLRGELELDNLHTSKIRYGQNQFPAADDFSGETSICRESGVREVNAIECSEILEEKEEKNFICTEPLENPGSSQLPLVGSSLICSDVLHGLFSINSSAHGKRAYTSVVKYSHWIQLVSDQEESENAHYNEVSETSFGGSQVDQILNPVPYQLSLRYHGSHVCGGVILNKKTALSAAHCFDPHLLLKVTTLPFNISRFLVVAGEQNLNEEDGTEQRFQIDQLFKHPNFRHFVRGNDIAVIHIKGEFNFTDSGRVNNVWISSPTTRTPNFQDFRGTATGWGRTRTDGNTSLVLLSVDLEFLEQARCKKEWDFLRKSMICGYNNISNICAGDSGGPLVLKNHLHGENRTKDLLVGISSFSHKICEQRNYPNGFTNVSYFYEWIAEKSSNSLCSSSQFQCFNGECIDNELKCDLKFDCADGSDEKVCSSQTLRLDYKMNEAQMPPNQVEIYYLESATNGTLLPVCEGTIISSDFILTVASCLEGRNERFIKIRANGQNGNESQIRTIDEVFSYAARDSDPSPFDVAVIRLSSELELGNFHPYKIPHSQNPFMADYDYYDEDSVCRERGIWEVNAILVSNCSGMMERTGKGNFICAEPVENPGVGLAGNKSYQLPLVGSSLICSDVLQGVLAVNSSAARRKRVYTSVAKYSHWIRLVVFGGYDNPFELGATTFGGTKINRIEYPVPYQLSLRYNGQRVCGGVILDKKTALSAAHCFDPHYLKAESFNLSGFLVVAGEQNLNQNDWTEQGFLIEKLFKHPNFTSIAKGNDIAVIWIKGEFHFNDHVNNVWISTPSNQTPNSQDLSGSAIGPITVDTFDLSGMPESVDLEFLGETRCKRHWPFLKDSMICGHTNSSNLCGSRSGDPLVLKNYEHSNNTRNNLLVGISSFASTRDSWCDTQNEVIGFTNVSWFYDWIAETRSNSLCLPCKFQCFNGQCIRKGLKCDQKFDCADGSDEKVCSAQTQADETEKAACKKQREEWAVRKDEIKRTTTFPKHQKFDLRNRTSIQKAGSAEVGSWGSVEYCPRDSIVTGFTVKFVPYRGSPASTGQIFAAIFSLGITSTIYAATNAFDDYGLVGIGLYCSSVLNGTLTKEIRSDYFTDKDIADLNNLAVNSTWVGSFCDSSYNCPQRHPAIGFEIKNQPDQGSHDDFGAVNFNLVCSGSQNGRLPRPPIEYGKSSVASDAKWSEDVMCPPLKAVCGLRTKVHRVHHKTDSSGLTDVELQCCHMVDL